MVRKDGDEAELRVDQVGEEKCEDQTERHRNGREDNRDFEALRQYGVADHLAEVGHADELWRREEIPLVKGEVACDGRRSQPPEQEAQDERRDEDVTHQRATLPQGQSVILPREPEAFSGCLVGSMGSHQLSLVNRREH